MIPESKYTKLQRLNALLVTFVAFLLLFSLSQWFYLSIPNTLDKPIGLDMIPTLERMIHAKTAFFSDDENATSQAWEAIEAGHGIVTVDSDWASSMNLIESMPDPFDPSKSIYVIAAYHDMHCIQYLRRHYFAMYSGQPVTWPLEHDLHCLDSLRQSTMCHADGTLLRTYGQRDAGTQQTVMCRDWDALRDWATAHTACYADFEYPSTETRWGKCDGGEDGLPKDSLLGVHEGGTSGNSDPNYN